MLKFISRRILKLEINETADYHDYIEDILREEIRNREKKAEENAQYKSL